MHVMSRRLCTVRGLDTTRWGPSDISSEDLDLYLDSRYGVRNVSGACDQWTSQTNTLDTFTQGTPLARPAIATGYGNQPCLRFDGTNSFLQFSGSVGRWKRFHTGEGSDVFAVAQYTGTDNGAVFGTCATNAPSTSAGAVMFAYPDAGGSDTWFGVQNGSSASRSIDNTSVGSYFSNDRPHLIRNALTDSESIKWIHEIDGFTVGSGNSYTQPLSSANEAGQMRIGQELSGSTARMGAMDLFAIVALKRRADSRLLSKLEKWASETFGVVLV